MNIKLKHYSQERRTIIDPKFQGSGYAGAEKYRRNRIPRSYWYRERAKIETMFKGFIKHKWEGSLKLVDISKPNTKIYDSNIDKMERNIKNLGYDGYYNSNYPNIIAIFIPLTVE